MNGDGMGGLTIAIAIAILLACVLLFVAPALVLFLSRKRLRKVAGMALRLRSERPRLVLRSVQLR